ncbi:MAG: molecular chaperone GrpE, heat shock protein [halophilic archaeon J07HB67]|jgi:Molecular chaperone GrpE (heat shock protein)|nr:MAG: molecular chaperone GrpE, heat shock protein [halophilic archaeon J07HB67]
MTGSDPTDDLDDLIKPNTGFVRYTRGDEQTNTGGADADEEGTPDHTDLVERLEETRREIDSLERTLEEERERRTAAEAELAEKREEVDRYVEAKEQRVREEKRRATASLVESLLTRVWTPLGRGLAGDSERGLREGVELTREEFRAVLAEEGVEIIDPEVGAPLDRAVHEVLRTVERPDRQSNTVLQTERPGFRLDDAVVKRAEVFVVD